MELILRGMEKANSVALRMNANVMTFNESFQSLPLP